MRARVVLVLATVVAAVAGSPGPAQAATNLSPFCSSGTIEHPFVRWLDPLPYVLADGGDLESTAGWRLSGGAQLVAGNEPFYVHSATDKSSLYLPPGSSATTPWTCIGLDRPTLRFFAVNSGSLLSALNVEMLYRTKSGAVRSLPVLPPLLGLTQREWFPTLLPLPLALDVVLRDLLMLDLNTTQVAFRFTPTSGLLFRGSWKIDDLYVDPWLTGW